MPGSHALTAGTKLIVRVLQDLVRRETFDSYGDLKEALKRRCAKLRIPYDAGLITDALDRLEEGGRRPLVPVVIPASVNPAAAQPKPIGRADAARILERLGVVVPEIASATWAEDSAKVAQDEEAARLRALEMGIVL
jgi:hypothetical protein